ncbi:MAG: NADH-quinone oxidoreductase subunit N [Actinobacteria bacterium]|nr:NADH-quinone oxidoreductase subunit N [Actinomycetota bacterium]
MDVNAVALLPEILLTLALCGVLVIDLFLPREKRWVAMPLSVLGVGATAGAVLYIWGTEATTLGGMFVVDPFALLFKLVFCLAAIVVFFISQDYIREERIHGGEYYTMMLSSLLGMLVIASSRDLIAIFVALELITLPSIVLAGIQKGDVRSNEASLKFFLFGVLSSALMLFGMSLLYGITGQTALTEIAQALAANEAANEIALLSIFFVVVGFGFKISAFPFQWWVPDTYEGAPVPVAAFLSVLSKTAGFVALLQIMFIGLGGLAELWAPLFGLLGVVTMTFGNLVALQQTHVVRLLAYSSIAQAGYIMLPLGVASSTNADLNETVVFATVTYLLIYAFMEIGAFAVAVVGGRRDGSYLISDYAGMFTRSPAIAVAMTVFLMSLAGIIPLAGFWAKFMVFRAVIEGGGLWLGVALALNTVLALFYYAAVSKTMFMDRSDRTDKVSLTLKLRGAITAMAVAVVVLGVLPGLITNIASGSHFF